MSKSCICLGLEVDVCSTVSIMTANREHSLTACVTVASYCLSILLGSWIIWLDLFLQFHPALCKDAFPPPQGCKGSNGESSKKEHWTEMTHRIDLLDCLFWDPLALPTSRLCSFHLAASWLTAADVTVPAHIRTAELEEDKLSVVTHDR